MHHGRRLLRLPVLVGLFLGCGPRLRGVDDRAWGFCRLQNLQRLADHPPLLGRVVGLAQRVTKGELDGQRPWQADLFRPEGHRRDQDRGQTACFQRACQHGHVDAAVGSGRGEQDAVYALGLEPFRYLGTIGFPPGGRVWWKALIAREGVGSVCQSADPPLGDQLSKAADR